MSGDKTQDLFGKQDNKSTSSPVDKSKVTGENVEDVKPQTDKSDKWHETTTDEERLSDVPLASNEAQEPVVPAELKKAKDIINTENSDKDKVSGESVEGVKPQTDKSDQWHETTTDEERLSDVPLASNEAQEPVVPAELKKAKEIINTENSDKDKVSGESVEGVKPQTDKSDKWYVPLSREGLKATLAGGVLAPSNYSHGTGTGLQSFLSDEIMLLKNGLTQDISETTELVGKKGFTVLVEVDFDDLSSSQMKGVNDHGKNCKASIDNSENAVLLFYPGAIPLTRINKIHFGNERNKQNFVARPFDNVPVVKDLLCVSEELFAQDFSFDMKNIIKNSKTNQKNNNLHSIYSEVDSFVGSAALMIRSLPAKKEWLEFAREILRPSDASKNLFHMFPNIIEDALQAILFQNSFEIMRKLAPNDGWQPKRVLQEIYSSIDSNDFDEDNKNRLSIWLNRCGDILDNKKQVNPLTDEGMKVGRAILLLLLRCDPESILASKSSSLEPGDEVLAFASILSGARVGFEELSNAIKFQSPMYDLLSCLKADMTNQAWKNSISNRVKYTPIVDMEIAESGTLASSYKLLINNNILFEKKDEGPVELRKIHAMAELIGKQLLYDREKSHLSIKYEFENNRTQTVYISLGMPTERGEKTIRFLSPCLDISTPKGRKLLTKAMLGKLLSKNCEASLYCRFALYEEEAAIVVLSDQLLGTMDNDELLLGMGHVAKTADEFEKEVGLDQF
jgi:hypothetical protein